MGKGFANVRIGEEMEELVVIRIYCGNFIGRKQQRQSKVSASIPYYEVWRQGQEY